MNNLMGECLRAFIQPALLFETLFSNHCCVEQTKLQSRGRKATKWEMKNWN